MSWTLWITGVSGSGKSALAGELARALADRGVPVRVLELDVLRGRLAPAPAPTSDDEDLVHRALVWTGKHLVAAGIPVIIDATGQRRAWRDLARTTLSAFGEVQLLCPPDIAARRTRRRARNDSTADASYEPASLPELELDMATIDLHAGTKAALDLALEYARHAAVRGRATRRGWTMWLTGLPGSGKTTLADVLAEGLERRRRSTRVLEYAELREFVVGGRPPSPSEEDLLHRALVVAATELTEAGARVVIDATAGRRLWRDLARRQIAHFAEVQLVAPPPLCDERERAVRWSLAPCPNGVRTRACVPTGPEFVLAYEHALAPDLVLRTDVMDVQTAGRELLHLADQLERSAAHAGRPRHEEPTMLVRNLMTPRTITTSPTTAVTDARALMVKERIRHLLVTSDDRLVGIVTDRDIRLNLPSPATSLSVWELNYLLARLTVGEVMTRSVIVVDPDRDAAEAARLMLDHRIGALPVLDGERLVGILTETDIVRAFAENATPAVATR